MGNDSIMTNLFYTLRCLTRYIWDGLRYQYVTSTKPIIIFVMSFIRDDNVNPNYEKGVA